MIFVWWEITLANVWREDCCCCCFIIFLSISFVIPQTVVHRVLSPWDFPGRNTGVGCHFLLQGIFPTRDWTHIFCTGRWICYHWASNQRREEMRQIQRWVGLGDNSKSLEYHGNREEGKADGKEMHIYQLGLTVFHVGWGRKVKERV